MDIIPAIDLLEGRCVRLRQGRYASARAYTADPVGVARGFQRAGARWIHLVDLDAAGSRGRTNRETIRRVRRAVSCGLEVGGGVRRLEDVAELLEAGVDRVVVGTVLVRRPREVGRWRARFGPVLMAGIDALDGAVRISGWEEDTPVPDVDLAREAGRLGLAGIIYTSIGRDGTLAGPDIERTNRVARAAALPVVLSGGVGSAADVEEAARRSEANVSGVIIGKALYEGRVDLAGLLRRYSSPSPGGR